MTYDRHTGESHASNQFGSPNCHFSGSAHFTCNVSRQKQEIMVERLLDDVVATNLI